MDVTFLGKPVQRVHLEVTNRCMLACPRCSRTGSGVIRDLQDLSAEVTGKIFNAQNGIRSATICGNYGDAIYHPRLAELLTIIKQAGVALDLTTNGSHRSERWWRELACVFGKQDRITFSIDGLEDTNHLYRVNSRWADVLTAVKVMTGAACRVRWKVIVFRHNEEQIERIKSFAEELGVNEVRINKSSRFLLDKEDPLRPENPVWIGVRSKNQNIVKRALKNGGLQGLNDKIAIRPQCAGGQEIFVDYRGRVYPCCACAMYRTSEYAAWFALPKERNSLAHRELADILSDPLWDELAEMWRSPERAPASCIKRCGVARELEGVLAPHEFIAKPQADNQKIKFSAK